MNTPISQHTRRYKSGKVAMVGHGVKVLPIPIKFAPMLVGEKGGARPNAVGAFSSTIDKQLRNEISDHAAYLFKPVQEWKENDMLDAVYDHPELFEKYPGLLKVKVVDMATAQPHELHARGTDTSLGEYNPENKTLYMRDRPLKDLQDTAVHEIQHAVQHQENMAGITDDVHQKFKEVSGKRFKNYYLPKLTELMKKYNLTPEDVTNFSIKNPDGTYQFHFDNPNANRDFYNVYAEIQEDKSNIYLHRVAEADARATALRRTMSPARREAQHFTDSYDENLPTHLY